MPPSYPRPDSPFDNAQGRLGRQSLHNRAERARRPSSTESSAHKSGERGSGGTARPSIATTARSRPKC